MRLIKCCMQDDQTSGYVKQGFTTALGRSDRIGESQARGFHA